MSKAVGPFQGDLRSITHIYFITGDLGFQDMADLPKSAGASTPDLLISAEPLFTGLQLRVPAAPLSLLPDMPKGQQDQSDPDQVCRPIQETVEDEIAPE